MGQDADILLKETGAKHWVMNGVLTEDCFAKIWDFNTSEKTIGSTAKSLL